MSIISRKEAEALIADGFPENTAVISFRDPGDAPLDFQDKAERVFAVAIHDIDRSVLPDFGLTEETYFPEVNDLAQFIMDAVTDGMSIICQCEYGQSRSAACAAAICEYFDHRGIQIFADDKYYPNQFVYNKVYSALKVYGG